MADKFATVADVPSAPSTYALVVTPSDDTPLTDIPKAIYVGSGGNIAMRGVAGAADQLWKNVPSGIVLPFRAQYVRATGTTAGDMLALY
jgi:type 1 fimbria pilin